MTDPYDDFFFDLRGFLVLKNALTAEEVQRINNTIDDVPPLGPGDWWGNVQRQSSDSHDASRGINLQNIVEGGEPFEELIDHPAWIEHAFRYVGEPHLFIDECFVSLRGPGEFINMHSGGWERRLRTQYAYADGKFTCGQINFLLALTDIGPGDGATTVIPGSHKSLICHPHMDRPYKERIKEPSDDVEGAIEVHLNAGDALLFVDSIAHGSAARVNEGERRILVYRYGPHWGATRFGYRYSDELLNRLTPRRRQILRPIAPLEPAQTVS